MPVSEEKQRRRSGWGREKGRLEGRTGKREGKGNLNWDVEKKTQRKTINQKNLIKPDMMSHT